MLDSVSLYAEELSYNDYAKDKTQRDGKREREEVERISGMEIPFFFVY